MHHHKAVYEQKRQLNASVAGMARFKPLNMRGLLSLYTLLYVGLSKQCADGEASGDVQGAAVFSEKGLDS